MGAQMLEAFPIVPIAGNLTLGVAVLSYNGALNIGVTADAACSPCGYVDVFVSGMEQSFEQLGIAGGVAAASVGVMGWLGGRFAVSGRKALLTSDRRPYGRS